MRLEAELWDALGEIAAREHMSVNEVCSRVRRIHHGTGLTSAMRILLISYFRAKAGAMAPASFDELLGQTFPPARGDSGPYPRPADAAPCGAPPAISSALSRFEPMAAGAIPDHRPEWWFAVFRIAGISIWIALTCPHTMRTFHKQGTLRV